MDSLYLLIPLSALLVLTIIGVFGWALQDGQFEELEREGSRILGRETPALDGDQGPAPTHPEESAIASNAPP